MKRIAGALICSIIWMMGVLQTAEAQLNITLPDTSFEVSQSEFKLPITIEGLSPDSILGFSFTITYSSSVVRMATTENGSLNGFTKSGTLSSGFSIVQNLLSEESYRVSGASSTPVWSDGVLMYLNMEVVGEGISEVVFADIEINEGEPAYTASDGLVTIGSPPLLVVEHPLGTIELDEDFGELVIADLDTMYTSFVGEGLSYEITSDSSEVFHAGLEESLLRLNSILDAYGEGEVIIRAYNETQQIYDTLQVIINPMNDPPAVINLPDTVQVGRETTFSIPLIDHIWDAEDVFQELTITFELDPDTLQFRVYMVQDTLKIDIPDYIGHVILTIQVTDSWGERVTATLVLEILEATSAEQEAGIPEAFKLYQNYPNPFNPTTVISYQLSDNSAVSLKVFDMLGREVAILVNGRKPAGEHQVSFDAAGLSSGIYLYRLQANDYMETRRMLLIK